MRLLARDIQVDTNLMLSDQAHIVCPWHIAEDQVMNGQPVQGESIGTTLRGIGPCYRDKVGRSHAIRLGDLYSSDFRERIEAIVDVKRRILLGLSGEGDGDFGLDPSRIHDEYLGYAERLRKHVNDTTAYLLDAVDDGKRLLFEGQERCSTSTMEPFRL